MSVLIVEVENQQRFRCRCDGCGIYGPPSSSTTEATASFTERNGTHFCTNCEARDQGNLEQLLEELRLRDPNVNIGPGSMARSLAEGLIHGPLGDQLAHLTRQLTSMVSSAFLSAPVAELVRGALPIDPLPTPPGVLAIYSEPEFVGRMPVRQDLTVLPADEPAKIPPWGSKRVRPSPPLPDWCQEGRLVRRRIDGVVFRIKVVGSQRLALYGGPHFVGPPYGEAYYDRADFDNAFEPVAPKTRWELLGEED